jgi:hypothetical protein
MDRAEIARKDNLVILTVRCKDDYAAMLLYDDIAKQMTGGGVRLDLETKPSTAGLAA